MKLIDRDGHVVETNNDFVIAQLLKHGAREYIPPKKRKSKEKDEQGE